MAERPKRTATAARARVRAAKRPHPGRSLILLEDISKTYDGGHVAVNALSEINIDINEGEYVAIMGPSGSGKSTLMHIIGCLDTPSAGFYYLKGQEISKYNNDQLARVRNREVGFIFQSFNLLPRLSASQNVEIPLLYSSVPVDEREERVAMMLSKVGLADRGHHRPNELSGGESQRVAIAMALANNPSIILADEPTGNLDSKTEEEIMKLLDDFNKQGVTVIVVTHDESVASHAKRTIRLRDGKII